MSSQESSDDEFFDAESDVAASNDSIRIRKSSSKLAGVADQAYPDCSPKTSADTASPPAEQPSARNNNEEPAAVAVTEGNGDGAVTSGKVNATSDEPDGGKEERPGATAPSGDQLDGAVLSMARPPAQLEEPAAVNVPPQVEASGPSAPPQSNTAQPESAPVREKQCEVPAKPAPGKRAPPPRPAPYKRKPVPAGTTRSAAVTGGDTRVSPGSMPSLASGAQAPSGAISTQGEATQSESTEPEAGFVSRYAEGVRSTPSVHGNFVVTNDKSPAVVSPVQSDTEAAISDSEILEGIFVKNLDTGESVPLSEAEKLIPNGVNPLALEIMRLTSEYIGECSDGEDGAAQESTTQAASAQAEAAAKIVKHKGKLAFKALKGKVKSVKKALEAHGDNDTETESENGDNVRFKVSGSHRGPPYEYDNLILRQDLSKEHSGPVWTLRFSTDGRLMASAGQDLTVRVWVLRKAKSTFEDMRNKYSTKEGGEAAEASRTTPERPASEDDALFDPKPFCSYTGHTADILDLAWSKNYFLLSASFDKTVRLWHVSRQECLACFQHTEFVTGIAFHPRDDRYFLSGSLDARLRLWNIPDKKVALWNEVEGTGNRLITAAGFVQNGKYAAAGTYDGRCLLYETEYLKYHTQIHVRSSRGKNSKGRKITGIVPMPGEDKILIASNDSRVRLYDLKDLSMVCKYKGAVNRSSQIEASFSADGSHIISGSENGFVYLWRTMNDVSRSPTARRDVNDCYESFAAPVSSQGGGQVTAAVFAPVPGLFADEGISENQDVLVAADYNGCIHVYSPASRGQ